MASSTPHEHTSDTDGAASSLFSTYERQYATTSTTVSTGLRQLQASASVNPSRAADKVRQLESQLREAEMTLQRMDMEARSATPQAASSALIKKVKDYRRDYQTLLMDVRKAGQSDGLGGGNEGAHRAELGLSGYKTEAQQQRDRLLTATDRLEQTGGRIREGRKQLLETEEVAGHVLDALHQQRASIERSRESMAETQVHATEAASIVDRMSSWWRHL